MIYKNILETVGKTPVVELKKVVPPKNPHRFWAKMECFNPGLSIKDRTALALVEGAEKRGEIKPGGTIIEATSGNTGLGLALVSVIKGYKAVFVMPDKISEEKRAILRAYGAKVIITPTNVEPDDPRSYYSVSKKLKEIIPGSFLANQYYNPDNIAIHYQTTGPEIWEQTEGKVDFFVAGVGTGGTVSGIGRYLKEQNPNIKVICPDPVGSILHDLYYKKETKPHPYKVEGVGEDILPGNVDMSVIDAFIKVSDEESFSMVHKIISNEALCVGPSSAMALAGAFKYSEQIRKAGNFLIIMPDSGRSYLSKAFNDNWLRDNGFMPSPMKSKKVGDLLDFKTDKTPVVSASVDQNVLEVVQLFKKHGISHVPIFSEGKLVGVLNESDLILPLTTGQLKPTEPVIHLVKGSVVWVNEEDSLELLLEHFNNGFIALLKNKDGKLHIITKIDLLDFMTKHFGEFN